MKPKLIENFKDASDEEVFKNCLKRIPESTLKKVVRVGHSIVVFAVIKDGSKEIEIKISMPRYKVARSK